MRTLVLVLDTATEECAMALGEREGLELTLIADNDFTARRAALSRLVPGISEMLQAANRRIEDVREVVVGRGPGSFTGVRIGVASAKGLAHGLGVPLFGVGTLDAVAWRFREYTGLLGVVGDAMRGEVYPALFRLEQGHAQRISDDLVAGPAEAAAAWRESAGEPLLLAGNGLAKYRDVFAETLGASATFAPMERWTPSGAGLLAAYAEARRTGREGSGDPGELLPVYTRLSDAEEAERERSGLPRALPDTGVNGPGELL